MSRAVRRWVGEGPTDLHLLRCPPRRDEKIAGPRLLLGPRLLIQPFPRLWHLRTARKGAVLATKAVETLGKGSVSAHHAPGKPRLQMVGHRLPDALQQARPEVEHRLQGHGRARQLSARTAVAPGTAFRI